MLNSYEYYDNAVAGAYAGAFMVYWIVMMVLSVLLLISMWKIYVKAGKPGWATLIPFYTEYVLFDIVFGNGWKFLMMLIPFYNIYLMIKLYLDLGKVFGKGTGFKLGLVFLPFIFMPILAFGQSTYQGPVR